MSKRLKLLPAFLMLLAGACTSIMTYVFNYDTNTGLWILVGVLVLFYILGIVAQQIIFKFETQIELEEQKRLEEEGIILEKDNPDAEEEGDNSDTSDKTEEQGDNPENNIGNTE